MQLANRNNSAQSDALPQWHTCKLPTTRDAIAARDPWGSAAHAPRDMTHNAASAFTLWPHKFPRGEFSKACIHVGKNISVGKKRNFVWEGPGVTLHSVSRKTQKMVQNHDFRKTTTHPRRNYPKPGAASFKHGQSCPRSRRIRVKDSFMRACHACPHSQPIGSLQMGLIIFW